MPRLWRSPVPAGAASHDFFGNHLWIRSIGRMSNSSSS
jgi:hypothetical protein